MKDILIATIIAVVVITASAFWLFAHKPANINTLHDTKFEIPEVNIKSKYNKDIDTDGSALGDGAIISRRINGMPGFKHYGVMNNGKVAHFNQYGLHLDSLSVFANDEVVKVVMPGQSKQSLVEFKNRFDKIMKKYKNLKYNATNNNCEHFMSELALGERQSIQIDYAKKTLMMYEPMIIDELKKRNANYMIPFVQLTINDFLKDTIINK